MVALKPLFFSLCLFQAEGSRLRQHLSDEEEKLKITEEASERKDKRIDELQRLLGGMEQESASLREAIRNREEELRELRKIREEGQKGDQRSANTNTLTEEKMLCQSVTIKSRVACVLTLCVYF